MSALLLLAAAFAVIIAVGSAAVALNDAVESWLRGTQERTAAGGGGFGRVAERARQRVWHGGGRGLPHPPALAVRARRRGPAVARRGNARERARRAGGAR
jgi:hypothetical protein